MNVLTVAQTQKLRATLQLLKVIKFILESDASVQFIFSIELFVSPATNLSHMANLAEKQFSTYPWAVFSDFQLKWLFNIIPVAPF